LGAAHDGPGRAALRGSGVPRAGARAAAPGSAEARLHARPARGARARGGAPGRRAHHRRALATIRPGRPPARAAHQPMLRPPSTARTWPVTYGAAVAKNTQARATSSGAPRRFSAVRAVIFASSASSSPSSGHRTGPGATAFTRTCGPSSRARRSEEHTSELQSRGHLVCRLLLEKKKKKKSRQIKNKTKKQNNEA